MLGGPTTRDVAYNKIFDYQCLGYSEASIVNLAQHLADPKIHLQKAHKSVHGPVIINDSRAESYDFSECQMNYQDHDVILPGETLLLEVARGCIFKCAFCSFPMNGKKKLDFIRNMDLIYQELVDNYERFGVTRYFFSDDTVNDSPEKCEMIHDVSKRLPFKLDWWGYIRLDLLTAHPKTVDWLFESGLRSAFFGIETLNPDTAKLIGKGGDRTRLFNTVRKIKQQYGDSVNLHAGFIYGLPHESMQSLQQTTDFLLSEQNPLDSWQAKVLNIRPNNQTYSTDFLSDLDKNYAKYGYSLLDNELRIPGSIYDLTRYEQGQMIWQNEHTNLPEVQKLVNDIYAKSHHVRNKISGQSAFDLAGLGIDLSNSLNKKLDQINWHELDKIKMQRMMLYKNNLFEKLSLPKIPTTETHAETFSSWLIEQA